MSKVLFSPKEESLETRADGRKCYSDGVMFVVDGNSVVQKELGIWKPQELIKMLKFMKMVFPIRFEFDENKVVTEDDKVVFAPKWDSMFRRRNSLGLSLGVSFDDGILYVVNQKDKRYQVIKLEEITKAMTEPKVIEKIIEKEVKVQDEIPWGKKSEATIDMFSDRYTQNEVKKTLSFTPPPMPKEICEYAKAFKKGFAERSIPEVMMGKSESGSDIQSEIKRKITAGEKVEPVQMGIEHYIKLAKEENKDA